MKHVKTTVNERLAAVRVSPYRFAFASEERCEPSLPIFRNTGMGRFCPDINNWLELDNYEIGNGFDVPDPTTTMVYVDRHRYNGANRDADKRRRPKPTPAPLPQHDEEQDK